MRECCFEDLKIQNATTISIKGKTKELERVVILERKRRWYCKYWFNS